MITVDVKGAIKGLTTKATEGTKQVRFATRVALTRTAQLVADAERREIADVFDRPTPYTLKALFVRPASSTRLNAEVKLKDEATKAVPAAVFLAPQVKGGERKQKRFERALQAVGALPPGYRAVPGSAAKLDAYGNMDRGQIVQLLSYFKAFPEAGYRANMTDKKRAALAKGTKAQQGFVYFAGRPGDRLPLGIWQRIKFAKGSAVKPVLIFVRSAHYQKLLDFQYVAKRVIDRDFPGQFEKALAEAMTTAR